MKIVFLSPGFFPKLGGVEKHVFEIALRLKKMGHEVSVLTEANLPRKSYSKSEQLVLKSDSEAKEPKQLVKSSYFDSYFVKGIKVVSFDFGESGFFKKFKIWWMFSKSINEFKNADIVHCHDVFIWYLPFRLIFARKKVFITFHGYEGYPLSKKNIFIHKISEILTNGNICVGDFIKKWYGTKPSFVIYGGAASIKVLNKKITKPSALFYGRLDNQTGILEYAKAAEEIKEKIPKFKFDIIGEGPLKHKINKKFKIYPFQEYPEKKLINYRFAFLSRYLSMLEAMMQKKLVIAHYDNPIKKDYLFMSPFAKLVVIAKDSKEIEKKVLRILSNRKEEIKLTEKAYEWAKNQTWDYVCKTYLTLWGL